MEKQHERSEQEKSRIGINGFLSLSIKPTLVCVHGSEGVIALKLELRHNLKIASGIMAAKERYLGSIGHRRIERPLTRDLRLHVRSPMAAQRQLPGVGDASHFCAQLCYAF